MSEKLLTLPSAKGDATIIIASIGRESASKKKNYTFAVYRVANKVAFVAVGLAMVIVGLADISNRVVGANNSTGMFMSAFAPLPLAGNVSSSLGIKFSHALTPITPEHIFIPSIGVDAYIESIGLDVKGAMAVPSSFAKVGWYKNGSLVGTSGRAVFAGHVNNALTKGGVFQHLSQVKEGDQIYVTDADDEGFIYFVERVEVYDAQHAPVHEIFSTQGTSSIAIVTCEGAWVASKHSYSERLVVYASIVE